MEGKLINLFLAKIELYLLKIIPMLIAACCLANTTFSYFGIELEILSYISGMSLLPLIYFYIASYRCKFCEYHRMFLHYIVVNNVLTIYDYYIGIPISADYLLDLHLIIAAICLFIILYLKLKHESKHKKIISKSYERNSR